VSESIELEKVGAMMRELHERLRALVPEYWPVGVQSEQEAAEPLSAVELEALLSAQEDLEHREAALGRAMTLLRRVWDESGEGTDVIRSQTNAANHWSEVVRWVYDSPEVEEPKPDPSQDERRTPIAAGWGRERSTVWVCPRCKHLHAITGDTWLDCVCGARYRFVYGDEPEADEPERWSGWSDEDLDRLGQMLGDGGHDLADLQAEVRRRHEADDGLSDAERRAVEVLAAGEWPDHPVHGVWRAGCMVAWLKAAGIALAWKEGE
jgi:hypothetical protein